MTSDIYTYKQILLGLRKEFLKAQKELEQLRDYVTIDDRNADRYYFNLYKNPYDGGLPELVLERDVKRGLLERLGLARAVPTRAFMVRDNNGFYYPLRKSWFKKDDFNMGIALGKEKEFQAVAEAILNSDFARYMTLSSNIHATCPPSISSPKPKIIARSFQFDLHTDVSNIAYLGRNNVIRFASVARPNEKWMPLTQEHLDYVSSLKFPKTAFSEYHQSVIEECIHDDRPIVLADEYEPETYVNLEMQDEGQRLVLTKSRSQSRNN